MAWAHKSAAWPTSGQNKAAGTSITSSPMAEAAAIGDFILAAIAKDNTSTTDGDNGEVTSVTDTKSNTYTKLQEFTNGQGAAAGGATISVWGCVLTVALTTSDTITFNFASCTAKAFSIDAFTIGAGSSVSVAGSATLANDGADPGSMTLSGLTSGQYLFVRCVANEGTGATYTQTTNYTQIPNLNTSGGGAASNMAFGGEWRIFTGTGDTSNPTWEASDNASVYIALKEVTGAVSGTGTASAAGSASATGNATKEAFGSGGLAFATATATGEATKEASSTVSAAATALGQGSGVYTAAGTASAAASASAGGSNIAAGVGTISAAGLAAATGSFSTAVSGAGTVSAACTATAEGDFDVIFTSSVGTVTAICTALATGARTGPVWSHVPDATDGWVHVPDAGGGWNEAA